MPDNIVARASVVVDSDLSAFDKAMGLLKGKSKRDIQAAMDAIKKDINKANLQIPIEVAKGDMAAVGTLNQYLNHLGNEMKRVQGSAIDMAGRQTGEESMARPRSSVGPTAGRGGRSCRWVYPCCKTSPNAQPRTAQSRPSEELCLAKLVGRPLSFQGLAGAGEARDIPVPPFRQANPATTRQETSNAGAIQEQIKNRSCR